MSVTIHIDYSNGATKTLPNVDPGSNMSVSGALDVAQLMRPGLSYEFEANFIDRGGRDVGRVTSIDGVAADDSQFWAIWVNDRTASDLRRVTLGSVTKFGSVRVEDGDVITCKLLRDDD
jgi:hypothetical protein